MHPTLKAALSRAWRDQQTLQFGTAPERARLVDQADETFCAFLDLLDGSRDATALTAAGQEIGLPAHYVTEALRSLEAAGLLDDALAVEASLAGHSPARREFLGPDLASLSLLHPAPGAGARALRRRAAARVEIRGAGRIGAAVAATLAAAGVGTVEVTDQGRVLPSDCAPGGIPVQDVGRLRTTAAREAVRRASGGVPGSTEGSSDTRTEATESPPRTSWCSPRGTAPAPSRGTPSRPGS